MPDTITDPTNPDLDNEFTDVSDLLPCTVCPCLIQCHRQVRDLQNFVLDTCNQASWEKVKGENLWKQL